MTIYSRSLNATTQDAKPVLSNIDKNLYNKRRTMDDQRKGKNAINLIKSKVVKPSIYSGLKEGQEEAKQSLKKEYKKKGGKVKAKVIMKKGGTVRSKSKVKSKK